MVEKSINQCLTVGKCHSLQSGINIAEEIIQFLHHNIWLNKSDYKATANLWQPLNIREVDVTIFVQHYEISKTYQALGSLRFVLGVRARIFRSMKLLINHHKIGWDLHINHIDWV